MGVAARDLGEKTPRKGKRRGSRFAGADGDKHVHKQLRIVNRKVCLICSFAVELCTHLNFILCMYMYVYSWITFHIYPYQTLTPGTLLLGAVQEIQEYEVLVSLPYNMCGGVPLTEVSDPITQLLELEAHSGNEGDVSCLCQTSWLKQGQ